MKPVLKIFIKNNCSGCVEARRMATWVTQNYPQLGVEIVDIDSPQAIVPEAVFATPTYMLDDRIVSLGNPYPDKVADWAAGAVRPLV